MAHLSISRAWEETRSVLAQNGRLLSTLAFAAVGLPALLSTVMAPSDPATPGDTNLFVDIILVGVALVGLIGQLALARMAFPPSISVGDALQHGVRRFFPLLGAVVMLFLGIIALFVPIALVAVLLGAKITPGMAPAELPGSVSLLLFVAFAGVIFVAVRLMPMTQVAALEDAGPVQIITRSWSLTNGNFWRLFGFLMMMLAATLVLSLAIAMTVGALVLLLLGTVEPWSVSALVLGIFQAILTSALTTVFVVMLVRIYAQLSGRSSTDASISGN